MVYSIRIANELDAGVIASLRVRLLDEASGPLPDNIKAALLTANESVLSEGLQNGTLISVLAFDGDTEVPIGTGSITLYSVLPGIKLPKGKQGYLQNMYVAPEYRRRGVGKHLLSILVEEATKRGHTRITLHATAWGDPLFRSFGFTEEDVALTPLVYETE